jgi:hypothetical protein
MGFPSASTKIPDRHDAQPGKRQDFEGDESRPSSLANQMDDELEELRTSREHQSR